MLKFRLLQIRITAKALSVIGRQTRARSWIVALRRYAFPRHLANLALGYRRLFGSFAEAHSCASRHIDAGHDHPEGIRDHVALADIVRESDYPVFFFLSDVSNRMQHVFDLGGNVGNLFYVYQRHLKFSDNLRWLVFDLPAQRATGQAMAAERNESRIHFVDSIEDANGADLFISSGSLHYFEEPLSEILGRLDILPRRVIVNRTPCSTAQDLITVQDADSYLVPCKLHSREELVQGMSRLGYTLRGEWPVYERKMWAPLYPDYSNFRYSGFYFDRT